MRPQRRQGDDTRPAADERAPRCPPSTTEREPRHVPAPAATRSLALLLRSVRPSHFEAEHDEATPATPVGAELRAGAALACCCLLEGESRHSVAPGACLPATLDWADERGVDSHLHPARWAVHWRRPLCATHHWQAGPGSCRVARCWRPRMPRFLGKHVPPRAQGDQLGGPAPPLERSLTCGLHTHPTPPHSGIASVPGGMLRRRKSMIRNSSLGTAKSGPTVLWAKQSWRSSRRDRFGTAAALEMLGQGLTKVTRAHASPGQPRRNAAVLCAWLAGPHCQPPPRARERRHRARTSTRAPQAPAGAAMQPRTLPPWCWAARQMPRRASGAASPPAPAGGTP